MFSSYLSIGYGLFIRLKVVGYDVEGGTHGDGVAVS